MEGVALPREPRRLHTVLAHYPRIAAGFAIGIGALALIGWLAGIRAISQPVATAPMMVANTAIMTLLSGVALWLLSGGQRARRSRSLGRVAAVGVLLIAGATLLEYVAGISFGIDRPAPEDRVGPWPEGRPAPQTAIAFAFTALALLLLDWRTRKGRFVSDYLAFVPGGVAIAALLGYLFGVPALYGQSAIVPYVGVSVPTALVLLALSVGLLAVHLERGMVSIIVAPDAGGVVARQLLVGLALFPVLSVLVVFGVRLGWYALPIAAALVVFLALSEATVFMLATAGRLSRIDAAQRRAVDELRASESRVRALVEQAKDGIFLADANGRYIDVNQAGCELLGYTRDELIGKTIADIVAPDERSRLDAERATVLAGRTARGEWRVVRRDGTEVPVEVVANMLTDSRWQAITRDISERQRTARLLADAFEAERQLRADLEAVDVARAAVSEAVTRLGDSDIDSVLAQIAEQVRALTSAEFAAVAIGDDPVRPFERVVTAGMPGEMADALRRMQRPACIVRTARPASGPLGEVSVQASFAGLQPPHPQLRAFVGMAICRGEHVIGCLFLANKRGGAEFSDRDERMVSLLADGAALAIETARRFSAETARRIWLQSVVDQLPDGVLVVDAQGQVRAINRALVKWALDPSLADQAASGNPAMFDIRDPHGNVVPFEELPMPRALSTGAPVPQLELSFRQPDGSLLPIEACAAPIRDDAGPIIGAVLVARDISERKEVERQREEWIAVVAHDLRQPIQTIMFSLELLSGTVPDRDRPLLGRLRTSASRLNRMIDDLLDAARISAKRLTVECTSRDIAGLVAEAIERIRLQDPTATIVLDAPAQQVAWIDPDRIHQVLVNLLSNAVKYRKEDTTILVEVRRTDEGVRIGVIDEGPPIDPDELPKLFSRFARTRSARGKRGLGLGLYICKGLVEAHGGRIWVDPSQPGWTKFYFTVPVSAPAPPEQAA